MHLTCHVCTGRGVLPCLPCMHMCACAGGQVAVLRMLTCTDSSLPHALPGICLHDARASHRPCPMQPLESALTSGSCFTRSVATARYLAHRGGGTYIGWYRPKNREQDGRQSCCCCIRSFATSSRQAQAAALSSAGCMCKCKCAIACVALHLHMRRSTMRHARPCMRFSSCTPCIQLPTPHGAMRPTWP